MPDDLSVAVERLRTSSQRLNAICDDAAQVIREVEAFLEESRVGVFASIEIERIPEDEEGFHFTTVNLTYCRHETGKFRITIVKQGSEDEYSTARAWSECTRDEKLQSLEKLPTLLIELANQVEARTEKARHALSQITFELPSSTKRKGG